MKKLLAMFSSFALLSTPAISIVSCSNTNSQHKDNNGDSIWAWLPGIENGKSVTSPNVWGELANPLSPSDSWDTNPNDWDGPTKTKLAVQLIDLLAVAILASGSKDNTKPIPDFQTSVPGFDTLFTNVLNDDTWTQFVAKAKNTYQNKVNQFKTQNPKNWEKDFNNYLDSTYPDIYGNSGSKKYEIEKQNFMAAIMTTGVEGGTSALNFLLQLLVTNNQTPYLYDPNFMSTIQNYYNVVSDAITNNTTPDDIFKAIYDALGKSNSTAETAIVDVFFNSSQFQTGSYDNYSTLTIATILQDLKSSTLSPAGQWNYVPIFTALDNATGTSDVIGLPEINKNYSPSGGGSTTNPNQMPNYQLSMFQSYFYEQWYQDKKPLAFSSMVVPFKSDVKPYADSQGLTSNVFDSSQVTNISTLINNLTASTPQTWLAQLTNTSQYPGATVSVSKDLMTLDSTESTTSSNILKYVLYSASQDIATGTSPNIVDLSTIKDSDPQVTIKNLTDPINRTKSSSQTFYKIYRWNEEGNTNKTNYIITFFDQNGLNIAHIDGCQYLSNVNSNWDAKIKDAQNINSKSEYNSLAENIQFTTNWQSLPEYNNIDKSNQSSWILNKQFNNSSYLYYLINQGMVNQNNSALALTSPYTFNPQTNFAAYVKNSTSGTDGTWWYWLYSFMNFVFSNINNTPANNWLNNFIKFGNNTSLSDNPTPNDPDFWFIQAMDTAETTLQGNPINSLITNYTKENTTIAGYPTGATSPNAQIPDLNSMYNTIYAWKNWHSLNVSSSKSAIKSAITKLNNFYSGINISEQKNFYDQVKLWAYYKEEKGNN